MAQISLNSAAEVPAGYQFDETPYLMSLTSPPGGSLYPKP